MPQETTKITYRIYCKTCGYTGPEHDAENDCYPDASAHRAKYPNHQMRVITTQTNSRALELNDEDETAD